MLGASILKPVCAAEISEAQIEETAQKATLKQNEHKKLATKADRLAAEMSEINKKLITAAKNIQEDEDKNLKIENDLGLLKNKLSLLETDFKDKYGNLRDVTASMQTFALYPTRSLLAQPLSPVDTIRSAIVMRDMTPVLLKQTNQIKKDLEEITRQKQEIEKKQAQLTAHRKNLLAQQKKLKTLVAEKKRLRQKYEGESLAAKREADKLASEAKDLRELMEKLEHDKELKRRRNEEIKKAAKKREEEALRRLEEEQKKRIQNGESKGFLNEFGAQYQEKDDDLFDEDHAVRLLPKSTGAASLNFASAKGKLVRPARGSTVTAYGQELSKGVVSKGMVVKTASGAQVVSPYDGSVIFSGPFKGYGNLIIIDHGQDYVSLLAGLNLIEAEVGQMVLAGEPVGQMPDSDYAKLYMEIRKSGKPLNPAPWFE